MSDLQRDIEEKPDLLIVARDANCKGVSQRERELRQEADKFETLKESIIYAIPDPHIELWLLLDSAAFKAVLGKGCAAPDQKMRSRSLQKIAKTDSL